MTSRFPFSLPPRGNPARLPALLVPVLGALALVQLLLPGAVTLPAVGTPARLTMPPLPAEPPLLSVPPALATRSLFAPSGAPGTGDAAALAAPDPLGGTMIAGTLRRGGTLLAIVQQPDRTVRFVGPGGDVAGWHIVALGPQAARLARGPGETLTVPYGTHAVAPGSALSNSTADEEQ